MKFIDNIFKSRSKKDGVFFCKIYEIIGFKPKTLSIYKRAFTHRSLNLKDKLGYDINYERLEFLGDSLLDSVISVHLFKQSPQGDEGYLTKMRAKAVNRKNLNQIGQSYDLLSLLHSEVKPECFSDNIYGNLIEALIAAIYLDQGFKKCEKFILDKIVKPFIDIEELENRVISYKSYMIEWCQKHKHQYKLIEYSDKEKSTNGQKYFAMIYQLNGKNIAKARALSKKKAEEKVCRRAYYTLQDQILD
ncbi:ribonuclease III family protein [Flavobacterium sp. CS20]|jgi:ribonuclease-3|uniref:ribonuclease III family protein n=1 Tax=Flavobacterium sp. CS20 TaxID=2775246 RepID=UPI001B3A0587|nr:ribonuclease III domain-containing protein [Flavobacterium sp. CS20]QTY26302.1 ribonuclease III [Flavobacterium sp. CS20]